MPNIFERVIIIILISKDEYKKIREKFPELHIRRTVVQKSKRGRYYMTERRDAMLYLLKDIRGQRVYGKRVPENISDHLI